jgi:hypothetical protein
LFIEDNNNITAISDKEEKKNYKGIEKGMPEVNYQSISDFMKAAGGQLVQVILYLRILYPEERLNLIYDYCKKEAIASDNDTQIKRKRKSLSNPSNNKKLLHLKKSIQSIQKKRKNNDNDIQIKLEPGYDFYVKTEDPNTEKFGFNFEEHIKKQQAIQAKLQQDKQREDKLKVEPYSEELQTLGSFPMSTGKTSNLRQKASEVEVLIFAALLELNSIKEENEKTVKRSKNAIRKSKKEALKSSLLAKGYSVESIGKIQHSTIIIIKNFFQYLRKLPPKEAMKIVMGEN